ncbi:MAG: hypothetical protein J6S21_05125, partial [Victivallales bacterium]|nr:hypothetical protein [Victivallales bacterium]
MSKPLYQLPLLLPVLLVCLYAASSDFLSIPESAAKKLLLEHGSRDRISFGSDGVRIRDSKEAPGGRWRLLQEIPGDMDLEVTMRFNDPARQGGYAGIIFDRKTPGTPGIGISLTERGTHLQVNFPPENKIEYLLLEKSESSTFRLRVQCKGDNIRVSVNGSVVLDRTGIERAAGDFCFRIYNSDVTFSNLVLRNAAELNLRNQLPNGSFEDALSPNMPLYWGISAWGNCEDHLLAMGGKLWNEWRRDTADPVHGRYAMRVAGCSRLGSCLFPVQANTPYTLTGWLRSEDEN